MRKIFILICLATWLAPIGFAAAHHVLGRPSYSLNEDSNTPPSVQGEVELGDFSVTYMVFPAFPKPGEPGRISLYARRISDGAPFEGAVTFKVRPDTWLSVLGIGGHVDELGTQRPDDNVFRQGFQVESRGDYLFSARFESGGEPHILEFPLRIGDPALIGPIGGAVAVVLVALVSVGVIQRRRSMTGKIRAAHEARRSDRK